MARQRAQRRTAARPASDRERLDELAAPQGLSPANLAHELAATDTATRARTMGDLQADAGNAALGRLLGGGHGHGVGFGMGQGGTTTRTTQLTITRDIDEAEVAGPADEVVPLDTASTGATESVGPVAASSYAVEGCTTLADVASVVGGRPEAGSVSWSPEWTWDAPSGPTIETVTVTVGITLEMPSWTPPSTMLPKARAEWQRWQAALQAHEQGHIDLVHSDFDGLARRLLGKTPRAATALFEGAKATLRRQSAAYDVRTGHGTRTGTIINVAIEQQELDEEQRKRDAEKTTGAGSRESAVPDVGDEGEG